LDLCWPTLRLQRRISSRERSWLSDSRARPSISRARSEQAGIAVKSRRNPGQAFQESLSSAQESALHLAKQTANELSGLDLRDRIDIQSFIWIVGNYREDQEDVRP